MRYRNLNLEAFNYHTANGEESFQVRVADSPAGAQRLADAEQVVLPVDLRKQLRKLDRRLLSMPEMIALGEALAGLIFPPSAREFLDDSRLLLKDDEGLRIQLKLDSYALTDFPWEYVYIPQPDTPPDQKGPMGFLVLDRRISLVRYEVLGQPPGTLEPVEKKGLRLVSLLANPAGYPELNLSVEQENIRRALKDVQGVNVQFFPDASVEILEDALAEDVHVFHFAGHGEFQGELGVAYGSQVGKGYIVLLGENRAPFLFPAEKLALNLKGRGVRMAVLGACEAGRRDQVNAWSGVVPALTGAGIPTVVGMQYRIFDQNAIAFSRRLYRALAAGQPIDAAVADGRLAIFNGGLENERDWGVPVLYLHLRAEEREGVLFPRPLVVESGKTWRDVLQRAQEQSARCIRSAQGSPEHPGPFIPEIYVHREPVEQELDAFLKSDCPGLVLVGDSGVGKTNLLYHWTLDLLKEGHSVFLYNCGGSIQIEVEREISQDLSLADPDELLPALSEIARLAEIEERQFVIIFDAINEVRGGRDAGPEEFLRRLDSLIGRLPDHNVHIVLSCSAATWNRLDRLGGNRLFWDRYHHTQDGNQILGLDAFTPQEFEVAYNLYRDFFDLHTQLAELPPLLQERLRRPLMLRMLADAYRGRDERITFDNLALGIFKRYYDEHVRQRSDRLFIDELAAEMLRQKRSTLPVDDLARNPELSKEILNENPDSSYYRLLDEGILTETSGDLLVGDTVKFTYSQVGAYILALSLARQSTSDQETISSLLHQASGFPLAWDTARSLLLLRKDFQTFAGLARSEEIELRELVVDALVELYTDEPATAKTIIDQLLQSDSMPAWRTALKAAFYIGPAARDLFIWAAIKGSPELRQVAKDTLYLIWCQGNLTSRQPVTGVLYMIWRYDPGFTFGLLNDLAARISPMALPDLPNILEFILELSITIYINHCEQADITQQTTDLWYDVLKNRLHMDLLNTGFLGPAFEKLIFQVVGRAFSRRLLDTALFTELAPANRFFDLSEKEKERFKQLVPLVDPQANILPHQADLEALLRSDIVLFNVLAAMILSIHAYQDFATTQPLLRSLFDELDGHGRLWVILGFAVLLPNTPPDWVGLLEDFTGRLIAENPAVFYGEDSDFLNQFDIVLAPLGLAYGKLGDDMPLFETFIQDGLSQGDHRLVNRCIKGLATVGFYYPHAVFHTLRKTIQDFTEAGLQEALIPALATIRTLHFDDVDLFQTQIGADESFRRRVSAAADVELVRRFIYWLGIYNNAVHQALFYPKMRRQLLMGGLIALAEARSAQDFITSYTPIPIKMVREAGYKLSEWTLPET